MLVTQHNWPRPIEAVLADASTENVVNDIHARLNATAVAQIITPHTVAEIQAALHLARQQGLAVSIAGGRHAMGGQQFGTGCLLLDLSEFTQVLDFNREHGEIEVEAGIEWPALLDYLLTHQDGPGPQWGIVQKQTGADRLSIGGALAANVHGRVLTSPPIIADVQAITLVDADGGVQYCDRQRQPELFRLAIGGYGLFGVIVAVRLRLAPRQKVQRVVEMVEVAALSAFLEQRIAEGFTYGDWQFSIDDQAADFLSIGICSCYRPMPADTPIPADQRVLSPEEWGQLLLLAHTRKAEAVDDYRRHYLATSGQIYWADTQQLADYTDGYHLLLDQYLEATVPATEMIAELYVPRSALAAFMAAVAADFRAHQVDLIYGTVRLIARDDESFLAWARESFACVIFNLHTVHTSEGLAHSTAAFRRLNDLALAYGGSFYLTYGRFATREQVEAAYPQFREFLRLKRQYDPTELFQSDWYRHYRDLFAEVIQE